MLLRMQKQKKRKRAMKNGLKESRMRCLRCKEMTTKKMTQYLKLKRARLLSKKAKE